MTPFTGPNTFDGYKQWIEGEALSKGGDGHYYSYNHRLEPGVHVRLEAFVKDGLDVVYIGYHHHIVLEFWENGTVRMHSGKNMSAVMALLNRYGPDHWQVWETAGRYYVGKDDHRWKIPFESVDGIGIPFATWEKGRSGLEI